MKVCLVYRSRMIAGHTRHPHEGSICGPRMPEGEDRKTTKQQIIVPLGVDETLEWCSIFILVPKAKGTVQLCVDPARLNNVLIRHLHRSHTLNDILLRLAGVKHLTLIIASLGYHNLRF